MADHAITETKGRGPDEIRHEIERTRSAMDETVDELADRLSPGRLVDEVWGRVRSGGADGLGGVMRDHPIPIALMGLGLGWLALEEATNRSSGDSKEEWPSRSGPPAGERMSSTEDDRSRVKEGASRAKKGVSQAASTVSDAASSVKNKVSGATSSARNTAHDTVDSVRAGMERAKRSASGMGSDTSDGADEAGSRGGAARSTAKSAGRKAKKTFTSVTEDNPLAVGALAFGVGLASGIAVPSTALDDRLMGSKSDELEDRAKRMGRETAETAKAVVREAANAASEEAKAQSEERQLDATAAEGVRRAKETAMQVANEAEQAARDVGRSAKDAAKERAEQDDSVHRQQESARRSDSLPSGGSPSPSAPPPPRAPRSG